MNDRAHLFVSALVGSLMLCSVYGDSVLSGFVMTAMVVMMIAHILDVALDSRSCRGLKHICIPVIALATLYTAPFGDLPKTPGQWMEYLLLPLSVVGLVSIPVFRIVGGQDEEVPRL